MNLLLAICLIGSGDWEWSAFAGQTTPVVKPIVKPDPTTTTTPSDGCCCPSGQCRCGPNGCKCEARVVVVQPPSIPLAEKIPDPPKIPPAKRWRLSDRSGQLWEFHDRERLIDWVKARNSTIPEYSPNPSFMQSWMSQQGGNCVGGNCSPGGY